MSLSEKISSSQVSSDLSEAKTDDYLADVDVVRACGMVAKDNPIGLALWRLKYAKDTRELKKILDYFVKWSVARDLREDDIDALLFVKKSLKYWIDSICDNCDGLGFMKIIGCPMLSDSPCQICNGSGKTNAPAGQDFKSLLDEIDKLERVVAKKIFAKLRD